MVWMHASMLDFNNEQSRALHGFRWTKIQRRPATLVCNASIKMGPLHWIVAA